MQSIVDQDIILHNTIETFTQFNSSMQTDIPVYMKIRTAIIQIDIPTVVTTEPVITDISSEKGIQ